MSFDFSGVQLCPSACPRQNVVGNACLILVLPLQIQRQILKILKDAGVWVKAGKWYLGWQGTRRCYRDPCCGFNSQENGRDKIHNIQRFWIWALPAPIWLSESQNSFRIMGYPELEILQWGRLKRQKKPHPKPCLGIKHSWNPLTVRYLVLLKANKALQSHGGNELGVSSCETFVTLRPVKHSWAPLRSEVTADLCWGGFWMLEFAFLCCCSLSCCRRLVRCFRQFCS